MQGQYRVEGLGALDGDIVNIMGAEPMYGWTYLKAGAGAANWLGNKHRTQRAIGAIVVTMHHITTIWPAASGFGDRRHVVWLYANTSLEFCSI